MVDYKENWNNFFFYPFVWKLQIQNVLLKLRDPSLSTGTLNRLCSRWYCGTNLFIWARRNNWITPYISKKISEHGKSIEEARKRWFFNLLWIGYKSKSEIWVLFILHVMFCMTKTPLRVQIRENVAWKMINKWICMKIRSFFPATDLFSWKPEQLICRRVSWWDAILQILLFGSNRCTVGWIHRKGQSELRQ